MKSKFMSEKPIALNLGLLLLRVVAGGTLLTHGWMKLQKVLAGDLAFADPVGIGPQASLYLAIFAEVICAALIVLGLFTRIALIPVIMTMIVAFFVVHAPDAFQVKELAFLYLTMFLTLLFTGPGKYAVDSRLR